MDKVTGRGTPVTIRHLTHHRRPTSLPPAWALAFGMLMLADIAMVYTPALPHSTGVMATVIALVAALKFTSWYPTQRAVRQA